MIIGAVLALGVLTGWLHLTAVGIIALNGDCSFRTG